MKQAIHDISVIICAYTEKRWDDLVAAVESVQQQTLPPNEIIVVIDHNPSLLKRVQEHLLDVVILENRRTPGLSGARNSGIEVAEGDIIAFLDDDAIADPNWLENLVIYYSDPHIAGVGGKIEPLWRGVRSPWFPDEFDWILSCTYCGLFMNPVAAHNGGTVRNMIGANMSLRKDILMSINGFHEAVGKGATGLLLNDVGGDDAEVSIHVARQYPDAQFFYTPTALVWHSVPVQRATLSYFLRRSYIEGLSKAKIVSMYGANKGLSTERNYTFKVLPHAVIRGVADTLLHRDPTGLTRAGAIVAAFMATLSGYVVGSVFFRLKKSNIDKKPLTDGMKSKVGISIAE